jgi:hypothetical protein
MARSYEQEEGGQNVKIARCITTISLLLLAILTIVDPLSLTASTPPPDSADTTLGKFISDAVSTAFPAINTIINTIFPNRDDKKKKPQAQEATTALKQQSTQAMANIEKISNDLDTVTIFLSNCIVAENQVIAMRTSLTGKTSLSPADITDLQTKWTIAEARLKRLASADKDLAKMGDTYIQTTLQSVVDANAGPTTNIGNHVKSGDLNSLNTELATLDGQLTAANAVAGTVISGVSLGLRSAKNTNAGAAGATTASQDVQKALSDLDTVVQKNLPPKH